VSVIQGGKFGQGFASSFFVKSISPGISDKFGDTTMLDRFYGASVAAIIGGTASSLGGGKFANGAQTAAIQYLFNQIANDFRESMGSTTVLKK
jgi:hypothetical protein